MPPRSKSNTFPSDERCCHVTNKKNCKPIRCANTISADDDASNWHLFCDAHKRTQRKYDDREQCLQHVQRVLQACGFLKQTGKKHSKDDRKQRNFWQNEHAHEKKSKQRQRSQERKRSSNAGTGKTDDNGNGSEYKHSNHEQPQPPPLTGFMAGLSPALACLGLKLSCTLAELKSAYRQKALQWHPDKHGNTPESTERMQMLNAYHELLLKHVSRHN